MPIVRERAVERRAVNYGDPSFIPPYPGWMSQARTAGIPVNQSTVRSLEVVQMALDLIIAGTIKRGSPLAYTVEVADNVSYRAWVPLQPQVLTDTFMYEGPLTNTQSRGLTETVISMALFDGAWWQVMGRDGNGDANYVQTLFPPLVDIKTEGRGQFATREYWYGMGTDRTLLDPANLVYIPLKSMPGHERGMSAIQDAAPIFGLALAAMQFGQSWFTQGAHTSMMLSAKGKLHPDAARRIAQQFAMWHVGTENAHVPLLVDEDMTAQPISANPDDSQMSVTMTNARAAIGSMLHIPFFMLDPIRGAPFSTYEEVAQLMEDTLYTNYVVPVEEAFAQLLRPGLSAAFRGDLVRPSSANLALKIQAAKGADVMTPNEMRTQWLGLAPSDQDVADQLGNPSPFNVAAGEGAAALGHAPTNFNSDDEGADD